MLHRYIWLMTPMLVLAHSALAGNPAPHVHGVAHLDVAVDGPTLSLHLDTPLDNLVGFEHPASNPAQRQAIDGMVAQLNKPEALFMPTPEAGCKPQVPRLVSAVLEPPQKSAASHHGHAHADMDVDFVFLCARPQHLHGIEVKLMSAFPRIHKVDVQIAAPKEQSVAHLEANSTRLSW